jgi:hypothetical protein
MASLLHDFVTNEPYRAAVQKEFAGIKALFAEYLEALATTYQVPKVADPK